MKLIYTSNMYVLTRGRARYDMFDVMLQNYLEKQNYLKNKILFRNIHLRNCTLKVLFLKNYGHLISHISKSCMMILFCFQMIDLTMKLFCLFLY